MSRTHNEIRVTGYGGQGVVLSGYLIGRAAALYQNLNATMTQSFGPEARGSACSVSMIISPQPIYYPYVVSADIFVALSPEGYSKFYPQVTDDAIIIIEEDLVNPGEIKKTQTLYACPATRIAEQLGRRLVLNVVMMGFFTAVTNLVSESAMRKAIEDSVPTGTEELNLMAFERGYAYFQERYQTGETAEAETQAQTQAGS